MLYLAFTILIYFRKPFNWPANSVDKNLVNLLESVFTLYSEKDKDFHPIPAQTQVCVKFHEAKYPKFHAGSDDYIDEIIVPPYCTASQPFVDPASGQVYCNLPGFGIAKFEVNMRET